MNCKTQKLAVICGHSISISEFLILRGGVSQKMFYNIARSSLKIQNMNS